MQEETGAQGSFRDRITKLVDAYRNENDADLFIYSGPIQAETVVVACDRIYSVTDECPNATLVLTTYGGHPHEAYRLARCFRKRYKKLKVLIAGPCKSAGTLIAVGSAEIAFGRHGELGPLDMQVPKPDELFARNSGLDMQLAMAIVRQYAFNAFEQFMVDLVAHTGGAISTKTACEVSANLVSGLFAPMMQQIDPQRLAEIDRSMTVAKDYGEKLKCGNLKDGALDQLVEGYSSHAHVIDELEAKELFNEVKRLTDTEEKILNELAFFVREPQPQAVFLCVTDEFGSKNANPEGGDHDATTNLNPNAGADDRASEGTDGTSRVDEAREAVPASVQADGRGEVDGNPRSSSQS